jgi:hypothetical protein
MKEFLPRINKTERGQIDASVYKNAFHHLSLSVPANWTLGFYNPQALVSFQTTDEKAEGQLHVVKLSSNPVTAEYLAGVYADGAGLQFLNGREVLYAAGYGYLGRYYGGSSRGQPMEFRIFVTLRKGKGYILVCEAPYEKADSYLLDIEQILRGFKFG